MSRSRDLANLAGDATGLETLTVSDITDLTATAAELNKLDGVTASTAELNKLTGVTADTNELNLLDGVTATTAELNYTDGVSSALQTQIDAKAPIASPTFTGTTNVSSGVTLPSNPTIVLGSNATFPSGHIVQSVFSPSIVANTTNHTSEAVAASVSSQITITSGNGVLIYWQAGQIYLDRNSGDMGYFARIKEGTTSSGTTLARGNERHTAHPSNWYTNISLWAYDSSPASTSPSYCFTLSLNGSGAWYVRLNATDSGNLKCFLFEVKQ